MVRLCVIAARPTPPGPTPPPFCFDLSSGMHTPLYCCHQVWYVVLHGNALFTYEQLLLSPSVSQLPCEHDINFMIERALFKTWLKAEKFPLLQLFRNSCTVKQCEIITWIEKCKSAGIQCNGWDLKVTLNIVYLRSRKTFGPFPGLKKSDFKVSERSRHLSSCSEHISFLNIYYVLNWYHGSLLVI